MAWTVELTPHAQRQLEKLDRQIAERIIAFLEDRIEGTEDPSKLAEPLTGGHRGRWKYRVGAYRLICEFHAAHLVVAVIKLGHRRDVYER